MSEMIVKLNADKVKLNGCEYVQDLVRCGECKWDKERMMPKAVKCIYEHKPDDFCSYGERKESE